MFYPSLMAQAGQVNMTGMLSLRFTKAETHHPSLTGEGSQQSVIQCSFLFTSY
jgi:hypothetical protein